MANPKTYEEAAQQVANLMAAMGGNVNAYEGERITDQPGVDTLDAAAASVRAYTKRHSGEEPQCPFETGMTPPGHSHQPEGETPGRDEELAFFQEWGVPSSAEDALDPEDRQDDALFWGDVTGIVLLDLIPESVSPEYSYHGTVYASKDLKAIYEGFRAAQRTGHAQTVTLGDGEYLMTLQKTAPRGRWELHDSAKGYIYRQSFVASAIAGEESLFIQVVTNEEECLGYMHNQWVFTSKQE